MILLGLLTAASFPFLLVITNAVWVSDEYPGFEYRVYDGSSPTHGIFKITYAAIVDEEQVCPLYVYCM